MDNLNLLCQTIRFQRTALQNSLAMISAVQQHGEKLLKTTLEQSPWIPGEGKDACLFLAGLWTKNLTGMTDLVDKNLATMERLTATGEKRGAGKAKPPEKPAAGPKEPASVSAQKATPESKQEAVPERKQSAEKSQTEEKEMSPPKEKEQTTAMAKTEAQKAAPVSEQPPGKKPEQPHGKQPSEKKKASEPKT